MSDKESESRKLGDLDIEVFTSRLRISISKFSAMQSHFLTFVIYLSRTEMR